MEDEEFNTQSSANESDSSQSGEQSNQSQSGNKQNSDKSGEQQDSNSSTNQSTKDKSEVGKIEVYEPENAEELITKFRKKKKKDLVLNTLLLIIMIEVFIVFTVFTKAKIHGDSMDPTLKNGQTVLCQKYGYTIHRNDIVIVNAKRLIQIADRESPDVLDYYQASEYLVKRVVGMPGDIMEYKGKALYINGELICANEDTDIANLFGDYNITKEETLAGKTEVIIPENQYYVVGDNYNVSIDSRYYGWFDRSEITMKVIKK